MWMMDKQTQKMKLRAMIWWRIWSKIMSKDLSWITMSRMDWMITINKMSFLMVKECRLIKSLIDRIDTDKTWMKEDLEHSLMRNMMMMIMTWLWASKWGRREWDKWELAWMIIWGEPILVKVEMKIIMHLILKKLKGPFKLGWKNQMLLNSLKDASIIFFLKDMKRK